MRALAPLQRGALLALCAAGCGGEAGARVVFGLTTDMAVGFDLERIEMVTKVDGAVMRTESLSYRDGELALPAALSGDPAEDGAEVELSIAAYRDGEAQPMMTRTVATRAERGRTLLLPVSLDAACAGHPCAPGSTCAEGTCVPAFIAPSALTEYDPRWLASAKDACKTSPAVAPAIVIGQGESGYAPLPDGAVVPIEAGPQGGHHVWLALQVAGLRQMGSIVQVKGHFPELDSDVPVFTSQLTLRKVRTGRCEIHGIRFQVDGGAPVEAVRGRSLDVEILLSDTSGDAATAGKRLVIAP